MGNSNAKPKSNSSNPTKSQIGSGKVPNPNSSSQENISQRESVLNFILTQKIPPEVIDSILRTLSQKKYIILKSLGQGSFGIVFQAVDKENKEVAIKLINAKEEESFRLCKQEVHNLKQVNSPYVIKLLDSFVDEENRIYYIVTEYCPKNSLFVYLENYPHPEEEPIIKIFKGIIRGIIDLHKHKVIHSDLKPANVLLDKNGEVKICDFGFSILKDNDGISLKVQKGKTDNYCAPEQILGSVGYLSDIYAAGLILRDLCFPKQKNEKHTYNLDKTIFPNLVQIIQAMTEQYPNNRIRLEDVMKKLDDSSHQWTIPKEKQSNAGAEANKDDQSNKVEVKSKIDQIFEEMKKEIDDLTEQNLQFQSEFFKNWENEIKKNRSQMIKL